MGEKLTPWEVEGDIKYDKLIKEFGLKKIETLPWIKESDDYFDKIAINMIKSRFFYAERDLAKALSSGNLAIVTGRGPSNKMHIGHLPFFLLARYFQRNFNADFYLIISDDEKYLVKDIPLEEIEHYAQENLKDILSLGFAPEKTFIVQDFNSPNIHRIAIKLSKHITYSTAKAVFGLKGEHNLGWTFYPAIQMAHILLPSIEKKKNVLVPMGIDQDPYMRISRDVAEKLKLPKPASIESIFLPSIDEESGKMSASKSSSATIWLDSKEEEVKEIITKKGLTGGQKTLKEQREKGGNPERCTIVEWIKYIFDEKEGREREKKCKQGEIICGECKKYLIEKINELLKNHRKGREKVKLEKYQVL